MTVQNHMGCFSYISFYIHLLLFSKVYSFQKNNNIRTNSPATLIGLGLRSASNIKYVMNLILLLTNSTTILIDIKPTFLYTLLLYLLIDYLIFVLFLISTVRLKNILLTSYLTITITKYVFNLKIA